MSEHKETAGRVASLAWRSLRDVSSNTPAAFLGALVAVGAVLTVQWFVTSGAVSGNALGWPFILKTRGVAAAFDAIEGASIALVAMPIYRAVLREEALPFAGLLTGRTLGMAAWLAAYRIFVSVVVLPTALIRPMATASGMSLVTLGLYTALGGLLGQLIVFFVWTRLGTVYATVALDMPASPAARLREAWRLSGPSQWRIIWSSVIAFLPLYAVTFAFAIFVYAMGGAQLLRRGSSLSWGGIAADGALAVASGALGAAVLAWNYRLITGRHHNLTADTFN